MQIIRHDETKKIVDVDRLWTGRQHSLPGRVTPCVKRVKRDSFGKHIFWSEASVSTSVTPVSAAVLYRIEKLSIPINPSHSII